MASSRRAQNRQDELAAGSSRGGREGMARKFEQTSVDLLRSSPRNQKGMDEELFELKKNPQELNRGAQPSTHTNNRKEKNAPVGRPDKGRPSPPRSKNHHSDSDSPVACHEEAPMRSTKQIQPSKRALFESILPRDVQSWADQMEDTRDLSEQGGEAKTSLQSGHEPGEDSRLQSQLFTMPDPRDQIHRVQDRNYDVHQECFKGTDDNEMLDSETNLDNYNGRVQQWEDERIGRHDQQAWDNSTTPEDQTTDQLCRHQNAQS
eukprot:c29982_g1_i1 orf=373-1158(+)